MPVSIDYAPQTWANGSGGGTKINAARLQHVEDGLDAVAAAVATSAADVAGETFTGNVTAPNQSGCISLAVGAGVPAGTPVGTVIVRY